MFFLWLLDREIERLRELLLLLVGVFKLMALSNVLLISLEPLTLTK